MFDYAQYIIHICLFYNNKPLLICSQTDFQIFFFFFFSICKFNLFENILRYTRAYYLRLKTYFQYIIKIVRYKVRFQKKKD